MQNFLYMTDGGYTDEEILKAERCVGRSPDSLAGV